MAYETSVATGKYLVFYTRQFQNSLPYIFQFQKVFPYANGIFIFVFSLIGFLFFVKNKVQKEIVFILIPAIIYFLYVGQLFVKWSRFMSPIFFLAPFFCLFIFMQIKNKFLTFVLLIIMVSPGIYFFSKYFSLDIRVNASNWITQNISSDSFILSESGNVENLPLNSNFKVDNFDFYQLDNGNSSLEKLIQDLDSASCILVPSRRVFKNQNNSNYPLSQKYYQNLFSGNLGFIEIKEFSNSKDLFLNSETAEETWSVFDSPTIRIYKKITNLTTDDYQTIFGQN